MNKRKEEATSTSDVEMKKRKPQNASPSTAQTCYPSFIPDDFSMTEFVAWEERMGWTANPCCKALEFAEPYMEIDPTLQLQIEFLMPLERNYAINLVGVILGTLTKTFTSHVTPTMRALVNTSWDSLCRLGIKLPLLEKFVAESQKPTALSDATEAKAEAVRSWRAIMEDLARIRGALVSRKEELAGASGEKRQQLLEDVARTEELVAAKEDELEKAVNIFDQKTEEWWKAHNLRWCSFPEYGEPTVWVRPGTGPEII